MEMSKRTRRDGGSDARDLNGFTLVELLVVVFFVAVVAALTTVRLSGVMAGAKIRAAEADLSTIREAFVGSAAHPGYLADMENIPGFSPMWLRIDNLLSPTNLLGRGGEKLDDITLANPREGYAAFEIFKKWNHEAQRGWRGPYLLQKRPVQNNYYDDHGALKEVPLVLAGLFPGPDHRRKGSEASFAERGFFPVDESRPDRWYAYGGGGEEAMADPWGNPYVLQIPPQSAFESPVSEAERFKYARLVSAGPNGELETPCYYYGTLTANDQRAIRLAGLVAGDTLGSRKDDLVLFLNRADVYE